MLSDISHDEALALLVEAGAEVTLTLKHYKAATPFLLKQFGRWDGIPTLNTVYILPSRFIPEYLPTFLPPGDIVQNSSEDDGTPFHQSEPSHPVPDSPCSVNSDGSGSWIGIPR